MFEYLGLRACKFWACLFIQQLDTVHTAWNMGCEHGVPHAPHQPRVSPANMSATPSSPGSLLCTLLSSAKSGPPIAPSCSRRIPADPGLSSRAGLSTLGVLCGLSLLCAWNSASSLLMLALSLRTHSAHEPYHISPDLKVDNLLIICCFHSQSPRRSHIGGKCRHSYTQQVKRSPPAWHFFMQSVPAKRSSVLPGVGLVAREGWFPGRLIHARQVHVPSV